MTLDLTPSQRRVLVFIADATRRRGFPPSVREICDRFNWKSTNSAATHLAALVKKGALTVDSQTARSMVLTAEGNQALQ